jgi:hypothetical protein
MTLRLIEGFDHFNTATLATQKGWTTSPASFTAVAGRVTGNAMQLSGTDAGALRSLPSSYADGVLGYAFNAVSVGPANYLIGILRAGVTNTIKILITTTGHIQIQNAGSTVIATGTATITANAYFYLEVKFHIAGASGTVSTQVNGVADIATTTGNFASSNIDTIVMYYNKSANVAMTQMLFDDIYFCDTAGTENKDFLGDRHVETLFPSGDGAHTDWTPNTGLTHFNLVNDITATFPDSDTTYVSSSTPGQLDTYTHPSLTVLTADIRGVQTNLWSRKDDASTRQIAPVFRIAGTDYVGTTATLATGYVDSTQIYENSPATSSDWTLSEINAAEFGVKEIA